MTNSPKFHIIQSPDADLHWPAALELVTKKEGWINSSADLDTFHKAFPGNFIFFVAAENDTEKFIGCVCLANYGEPNPMSMIGLYAVIPEARGFGVGSALFNAALSIAHPKRFLYGAETMKERYASVYGFVNCPTWHILTGAMDASMLNVEGLKSDPKLFCEHPAAKGWSYIAKYYRKYLREVDGSQMIRAFFESPGSYSRVAVTDACRVVGLARVRECENSILAIGPVLGDDLIAATTALRGALLSVPDIRQFDKITIQWPSSNTEVRDILNELSFNNLKPTGHRVFPQYTHKPFDLPVSHIYAISQDDVALV